MSMQKPRIGFIGAGLMGHGMARNIVEKGHQLTVMAHRNRAPIDDLIGRGASEAATPQAVAEASDMVVLCVTSSAVVEAVVYGPHGLMAAAQPGLTIIDCSTADPVSTVKVAADLAARGVAFCDAPLSRTPKEAWEGTLDVMAGGTPEVFAQVEPVLRCFAGKVVHMGPVGAGHTMKLLNNFLSMGYAALYSEALSLGARNGITPTAFHAVVGGGRMDCGFYQTFMKYVVGRDKDAHKFSLRNAHKDLRYVAQLALASGVLNPMGAAARNWFGLAEAGGKGDLFVPMLSDVVAEANGLDLRPESERG
jgi:hypothetical protein